MRRKSAQGSLYVPSREVSSQVPAPDIALPSSKMWLFKPNMRLSYKASKHYLLPERGTIQAAKVLFKVLGPSMSSMDLGNLLDRYPGFPQAEQLMYPKNTCTQIALLLRESNACYPEGMRTMTRLDVGWLLRA